MSRTHPTILHCSVKKNENKNWISSSKITFNSDRIQYDHSKIIKSLSQKIKPISDLFDKFLIQSGIFQNPIHNLHQKINVDFKKIINKFPKFTRKQKFNGKFESHLTLDEKTFTLEDLNFVSSLDQSNKEALDMLLKLYHSKDNDWSFVAKKHDVSVFRRFLDAGTFVNKEDATRGSKHACVKSCGVINAKPRDVYELFMNTPKTNEYNEHILTNHDIFYFSNNQSNTNSWNKVSYATGPKMGLFKARDFVSVVNFIQNTGKNKDSYIILNRPAYFSSFKPKSNYVRATVLLAGNIIEPYDNDKSKTKLTLIAHVNPGGGGDNSAVAWMINQLCAVGPPIFIRKVEAATQDFTKKW